ncbi:glycoside hydrolase family 2 [Saccharicrinis aurantiacus]|uniref:glycoside hydrolase family 2 n=1 Tax=Saccharicrinis aurantiacus TaxID=1849719 RepID=UPI0009503564|nr:glycoside hydrolase family 2 [Saccharicrinis aurantiacus]
MKNSLIIISILIIVTQSIFAQNKTSFNDGWYFNIASSDNSKIVSLPHHYNSDAYITSNYYRGDATYQKRFFVKKQNQELDNFLYFEGVNSRADIYVNDKKAYTHKGGYTGFYLDITELVKYGEHNTIKVIANNTNVDIPPLSGDFTIFGGIYRPVWFITKNKIQFRISDYGNNGVLISQKVNSENKIYASVDVSINNNTSKKTKVSINYYLYPPQGSQVYIHTIKKNIPSGESKIKYDLPSIKDVQLWSPSHPNLYQLEVVIKNSKGETLDRVSNNIGWRTISLDKNNALILNGKPIKLMGASRHQDRAGFGIALSDQQHIDDIKLMKELGCNFIRLAHYPQSKAVLDACDELGLLVWEEIPVVDLINNNSEFKANAKQALHEMIFQHYNHPSIIMWGYMNEAIIQVPHRIKDKSERSTQYKATVDFAHELEKLCKELDPSRYTVMAYHGTQLYNEIELSAVAQISGWNLYNGWYGNKLSDFEEFISEEHRKYPNRSLIISEFGAGSDKRIHSLKPRKFDFSIEYQQKFMEHYWPIIRDSSFIMGGAMWNLIDFSSAARQESMPHTNNKGLVYGNREHKDVFYYQKAFLNTETPVVHIATRDWTKRTLIDSDSIQTIKVYSNLDSVSLYLNNQFISKKKTNNYIATWDLPLPKGFNSLTASGSWNGKLIEDQYKINIDYIKRHSSTLDKAAIHINCGSDAYFHENGSSKVYLPDLPYQQGSWGYINGTALELGDRPGTTAEIKGTLNDPLYQTQRQGDFSYQFDLKPGSYELTLHFADLNSFGPPLAYDLGVENHSNTTKQSMNISINDMLIEKAFTPSELVGGRTKLTKTYIVNSGHNGLVLKLESENSKPFLNGISLIFKR